MSSLPGGRLIPDPVICSWFEGPFGFILAFFSAYMITPNLFIEVIQSCVIKLD
jgi:hypothetical protein